MEKKNCSMYITSALNRDIFIFRLNKGKMIKKSSHAFTAFHLDFHLPPFSSHAHTPHLSWYAITNASASTFLFLLLQLSLYSSGVCLN